MDSNYIAQYEIIHKIRKNYGMTSISLYKKILPLIQECNPYSILDFGCGKSKLADKIQQQLNIHTYRYDPAIPEYSQLPIKSTDFIICTDVLQHVPIFDLDRVLIQIKNLSQHAFFHINCNYHHRLLPNGEPANCTVYSPNWWKKKLGVYFDKVRKIQTHDPRKPSFFTERNQ
ncbi:MAG: class I SAM-dependent methyltransferase [Lactobacillales bacterium]|nr:class I SAM-dependent methyltransferase [Lactobacillales bacterium]